MYSELLELPELTPVTWKIFDDDDLRCYTGAPWKHGLLALRDTLYIASHHDDEVTF